MSATPNKSAPRWDSLDAARGLAIALMFFSHTVKGLLNFKLMPEFAIVPIHVLTKFSSALFIIVFGVTLAVVYLPKVGGPTWASLQMQLLRRGVLIMFWYKVLILVQMFQRSKTPIIIDTLLWQRFPDFVEILQFYAWFVLLLPLILPAWKRLPLIGKPLAICGIFALGWYLRTNFDFWGVWQLKAVLVEDKRAFCFGILSRGPVALFGLFLGELILLNGNRTQNRLIFSVTTLGIGVVCLAIFMSLYAHNLYPILNALARNWGKHPPNLAFMLYANGGALVLLGWFFLANNQILRFLKPLVMIGRESLYCFNHHIIFIWVVYRYIFDLRHKVSYTQALFLTLIVFLTAWLGAWLNTWRKKLKKAKIVNVADPLGAGTTN